ncbi:eukaryotic translation initiation factor 3 subunit L isoform X1 [Contarinia nasturtii]|uniref:eukaryotic translation initiation factor 3 subunit L isoform X1 n=1 Tax=Contarinia nasturtii TaxID=265458 RepID=UPI0012D46087|nr:eukaryotic translation initiation factor 3 subunit L isoform X1 [Contarinia nasturtii]
MLDQDDYDPVSYDRDYMYDEDSHTGDPTLDLEYERSMSVPKVPDIVKNFIEYFRTVISEGVVYEIQNSYENTFPKLSEQYYDKRAWPSENQIADIVGTDDVFLTLYKELYFRHIYARIPEGPTIHERADSFFNYCSFFNLILSAPQPFQLELPDIWLWELLDEFVYQFQNYAQYRARLNDKNEEELNILKHTNHWTILCILNVLHSLVDKSNIKLQLEVSASGGDPESVAGEFGRHSLYKMLGYFSLVEMLRLHSLLGDYYQAIKVLEPIEIHKKNQYTHIPACQISTSYYVGFAYMMMRRYTDAIRTFSSILLFIQRTKQLYSTRSYQNDQINKQTEQMYQLLTICLVLHPQCIDESIQQALRDKNYHESMYQMQCGDLDTFRNFFIFGSPKFISPCPPPNDATEGDFVKQPMEHQTQVFMDEVRQQQELPTIRSYLKLYTTLPLEKLASFMNKEPAERDINNLLTHLLCFKHKMKNLVWSEGSSGLDGKFVSGSELDFYIDLDMIHIADTKVAHRYGEFFIRKILKFGDLNRRLHNLKI